MFINCKVDVRKKVEELKKYQQKIGMDGGKQPGNKKKGPKLSDYSKWFTKYQAGSLELPGYHLTQEFSYLSADL